MKRTLSSSSYVVKEDINLQSDLLIRSLNQTQNLTIEDIRTVKDQSKIIVHQVVHPNQVTLQDQVHLIAHHLHLRQAVNQCQKVVPIENNKENIESRSI